MEFADRLDGLGLDVISELAKGISGMCEYDKVDRLLQLLPYLYPKRKAVELVPTMTPLTSMFDGMTDEAKREQLKSLLEKLAPRMGCKLVPLTDDDR